MIVDLERFIERERPLWDELEYVLDRLERTSGKGLDLAQAKRLHYLYERAAAALARIQTFSSDPDVREHLESLVARAYGLIHSAGRRQGRRFNPLTWFVGTFPRTVRRHWRALALATAVLLAGTLFGGAAVIYDPDSRHALMPFGHADMRPRDRVAQEEAAGGTRATGMKTAFSSLLMTNNIKVSIAAMALGATGGLGTIVMLFYNGVGLGAVMLDYVRDGQSEFLAAWLLPHGSVEIPAILIAGQAGLVLGAALIGRGDRKPLKVRLREILPALVTLIFGVAVLLVWAGILEAFLSQYHPPTVPYSLKILFGSVQLVLLAAFLALAGRRGARDGALPA